MSRSIVSQIFSGLAYAAGGLLGLGFLLSLLPNPHSLPKDMMPPQEGMNLQFVHMALLTYSLDHGGKYPETLDEIANDEVLRSGRGDVIESKNLKYIRPTFSDSDPYNQKNGDDVVLIYETDKWYFSVTINGTRNYYKKKKPNGPMDLTTGHAALSVVSTVVTLRSGTDAAKTKSSLSAFTPAGLMATSGPPVASHRVR